MWWIPTFWSSRMRGARLDWRGSWAGRARRLGLFTDAAQRFERGVDPTLPPLAIERATALLVGIVGGDPGPVQVTRAAAGGAGGEEGWVSLRRSRLARLLGVSVPDDEVHSV